MYLSPKHTHTPPSDRWIRDPRTAMVEIADIGTGSSPWHTLAGICLGFIPFSGCSIAWFLKLITLLRLLNNLLYASIYDMYPKNAVQLLILKNSWYFTTSTPDEEAAILNADDHMTLFPWQSNEISLRNPARIWNYGLLPDLEWPDLAIFY